ncbi:EXO1_2 [Blepharisma stoltei]|uniref:Exonuclease 1 n=1 Tax=Blepharisma stoltei TaxID=1481888 RepID=A0AAU9J4E6_9CILI|nr:unnamed protein product [Blepharisma stoltei]
MGIQGLLQLLKPLMTEKRIDEYSGQRIGVDSYCWLHKSVFTCSKDLAEGRSTKRHIEYCVRRALDLKKAGIEPVMVFDGAPMPAKGETNEARRNGRKEALEKANELLKIGNLKEADKQFAKSISVTPTMAFELIKELKKYEIECIVAPYEADAQLAYLFKIGYISAAISEDSDLLVFGCQKVLYKYETNGILQEMNMENLYKHPTFNFSRWSHEQFMMMCILAGCDYLKNFKGIGIKTAHKIISKTTDLTRIMYKIKLEVNNIGENYQKEFLTAMYSFRHHQVFCPVNKRVVHINEMDEQVVKNAGNLEFLGQKLEDKAAQLIAQGKMHPLTKELFEVEESSALKRKKILDYFEKSGPIKFEKKPKKNESDFITIVQYIENTKKQTKTSKFFNSQSNKENIINEDDEEIVENSANNSKFEKIDISDLFKANVLQNNEIHRKEPETDSDKQPTSNSNQSFDSISSLSRLSCYAYRSKLL